MENNVNRSDTATAGVDRRAFVSGLLKKIPDAFVITGLGSSTYDVFAAGDRNRNFYLWGAMGGASAIGLGLAIAQPEKQVVVITGDGEQLMGIGSLASIGAQQPDNLTIVVLDNGHFGETGMQRSHTSLGTNLAAVAQACGIGNAFQAREMQAIETIARAVVARGGVTLAQVIVRADDLPRALPSRDGVYIKNRFRQELGFAPL
jgi:thiamine pyrophosphate-dependent acetolactate synthase large subunit-like protein